MFVSSTWRLYIFVFIQQIRKLACPPSFLHLFSKSIMYFRYSEYQDFFMFWIIYLTKTFFLWVNVNMLLCISLTGHFSKPQKVIQTQNRQFSRNLCLSNLSWSKLTTQNIFDLQWSVWLWRPFWFLRPLTKLAYPAEPRISTKLWLV